MSADTSFSPRVCPSCGRENPKEATRCDYCLAPFPGTGEITAVPPTPPPNPFRLPSLPSPEEATRFLVIFCLLLGLFTFGIGCISFLVLIPVFIHLYQASKSPTYSIWNKITIPSAGVGVALWVFASAVITFVAVCGPAGYAADTASLGGHFGNLISMLLFVAAWVGGILTAACVSYLLARRFFPLDRR